MKAKEFCLWLDPHDDFQRHDKSLARAFSRSLLSFSAAVSSLLLVHT